MGELRDGIARWYVVHTRTGYENKVKTDLEKTVENRNMQDRILEIKIPTEEVVEKREDGKKKVVQRKLYPCYLMVKMIMDNESWYVVRNASGVTGFVRIEQISKTKPADAGGAVVKVTGVQYRYVNVMNTPLYKSASTSSGRYTRMVKGAKVRIGAYNDTWACVKYDGRTGYVKLSALSVEKPTQETEKYGLITYEECIAMTTKKVKMYKKPEANAKTVATVAKGLKAVVYAYNEEFAYVKVEEKYGFIALEYLKKVA